MRTQRFTGIACGHFEYAASCCLWELLLLIEIHNPKSVTHFHRRFNYKVNDCSLDDVLLQSWCAYMHEDLADPEAFVENTGPGA